MSQLTSFICNRKHKRESPNNTFENKDFCNIAMLSENTKILEFNQYQKSNKEPFIIYADLECLIEKIYRCENNAENSFTTKVGEHSPSGFSISTILSFKSIENKNDVFRGKDYMKKFCESLREHAIKIIIFKMKKKEKEVINKRAAGIIRKSKNLLHLKEKF